MNERIRELIEQATEPPVFPANIGYFNREKFAESLIREAAQFVSGSSEVYTQAEQDACVRAAIGLKKYFGIEE